jgi:hypothetical protein
MVFLKDIVWTIYGKKMGLGFLQIMEIQLKHFLNPIYLIYDGINEVHLASICKGHARVFLKDIVWTIYGKKMGLGCLQIMETQLKHFLNPIYLIYDGINEIHLASICKGHARVFLKDIVWTIYGKKNGVGMCSNNGDAIETFPESYIFDL